jgi:hypothetical protein
MIARSGGCVVSHRLSTRFSVNLSSEIVGHCGQGGDMLLMAALVLGVYDAGTLVHVLLLAGLMLLLLGVLKARDAPAPGRTGSGDGPR